jgi:hypothetical protein
LPPMRSMSSNTTGWKPIHQPAARGTRHRGRLTWRMTRTVPDGSSARHFARGRTGRA